MEVDGECLTCDSKCLECYGPSDSECTSCANDPSDNDGYFLLLNSCLDECPDGFYADNIEKKCHPCPSTCSKCLSYDMCTECIPGAYILAGG